MDLIILLVIAAVVVLVVVVKNYNALKVLAEHVTEALSNMLVSMQKRADLANKLQEIASTYAKDEQFTMISIAKDASAERIVNAYSDSLRAVSAVNMAAQRFPDLKTDRLYVDLMHQLHGIENEIQTKREVYNAKVRAYNAPLKQIPTTFYAGALGLTEAPYWQSDDPESLAKLKEFKTDDARVRELMGKVGTGVKQGATAVGTGVAGATNRGVAAVKTRIEESRAATAEPIEVQTEEPPAATP